MGKKRGLITLLRRLGLMRGLQLSADFATGEYFSFDGGDYIEEKWAEGLHKPGAKFTLARLARKKA